jgi:hypothetical protein
MTALHVQELAEIGMPVLRDLPIVQMAALGYRLAMQEIRRRPRPTFAEELENRDAGSARWSMDCSAHPAPDWFRIFQKSKYNARSSLPARSAVLKN